MPLLTLEEYLRREYAEGKIDFSMRVSVFHGVELYIHPSGRDGSTTPNLRVDGNTVSVVPGSSAPGWTEPESTAPHTPVFDRMREAVRRDADSIDPTIRR